MLNSQQQHVKYTRHMMIANFAKQVSLQQHLDLELLI